MQGQIRQWLVMFSTALVITVNALANILPINGQNTGQISDSFPVYFVPAGYVFSIWGLIYILLIGYSVYQAQSKQRDNRILDSIGSWYILSSAANILWILLWHYNYPVVSVAAMFVLLLSLIKMYSILRLNDSKADAWFVKLPVSVYLGWISVATIANISVALYSLEWGALGLSGQAWTAILVGIVTGLTCIMLIRNRDIAYYLVILWALIGVAVKFPNEDLIVNSILVSIGVTTVFLFTVFSKQRVKIS